MIRVRHVRAVRWKPISRYARSSSRRRDFRARGLRHPPQAGHPADDQRGAALSGAGGILLSRGARRDPQGGAGRLRPRARARRNQERHAGALSAIAGRRPASWPSSGRGLFDRFEPLDVPALLRAYFDRLFARAGGRHERPAPSPESSFLARWRSPPAASRTTTPIRAGSRPISSSLHPTKSGACRRSRCARAIPSRPAIRCSPSTMISSNRRPRAG